MNVFIRTVRNVAGNSYYRQLAFPKCQPNHNYSTESRQNVAEDGTSAGTNTIDEDEVANFNRQGDEWWKEEGEFVALHRLNDLRVPLIRDALLSRRAASGDAKAPQPLAGLSILDVGCGGGLLSEPLARLGANVTGVDAAEECIKVARSHASLDPEINARLNYRCTTIESLATLEGGTYDGIVASEIIEHVNDQSGFVSACCESLKPGGSIFFTTLSRTSLSFALGIVLAERVLGIVAPGTHNWNKFVTPDELQDMLTQCGMDVRLVHGMLFNPLTSRWSWISDTSINYAIHAVKPSKTSTDIPPEPSR